MKVCTRCGDRKPLDAFPRKEASKDGRYSWCRVCSTAASRCRRKGTKLAMDVHEGSGLPPMLWRLERDPYQQLRLREQYEAMLAPPPLDCLKV